MVTGVSAVNSAHIPTAEQSIRKPAAAPSPSSSNEDTVTLSPAAQQASKPSGDVDHDGDSH